MPERRELPAINIRPREMPFDQIIAVKGRNPIGESLPMFGKVLSDAMVQRANLIKMGQQTAAIEKATGAAPGEFSGLEPEQAMKIGELRQRSELKKLMENYTIPTYDSYGNVSGFTPVPEGMKPFGGGRPPIQNVNPAANKNAELRRDTNIAGIVKAFTTDASVKKSQQALDAAGDIRMFVESGNPISVNAIPTYAARMAGEVGALSEADKRPFGGSLALEQRLKQSFTQMATGQLNDENKQFMRGLTDLIDSRAKSKIDLIARKRAGQYGGTFGNSSDDWYNRFMSEYKTNSFPSNTQTENKVISPQENLRNKYGY